ncbi:phosphoadenosine phosphosulfate reductase [Paraflavitalea soli]|uniref:Phosphoadenosine phosphosulfate reductase n=1 Tax=Paraflavitalea soli TaxID=2315862 RepID=A0A3B7MKK4_9BACT|nr:phosphoadenosine phosphosulfate reductase family protein [Paraflavitalea soli]AXY73640.1 phosphoadenosine phosphosulfate reductase [Paraflavitalea soli]
MKFCSNCLSPISGKDKRAIALIKKEYFKDDRPWYLGYSGGKDSSALLTLVFNALIEIPVHHKEINIIYCDTGVEIPTVSIYVKNTIAALEIESNKFNLPIKFNIVKPKLDDRYFVKVIGRGYPPPTNIFRWCTDRLRINPVKSIINQQEKSTVLLGVRMGESAERDKTIKKYNTNSKYYLNQGTSTKTKIFSPIVNYSLKDIWSTLKHNAFPSSIDHSIIGQIYKDAGNECPVYKETKGTPCGKGRFGCWTCTVVRKDKSVESMITNGHNSLDELFKFRNWLIEFRDNPKYRCTVRRNGDSGRGPITLTGRKIILDKLLYAQQMSNLKLIEDHEIKRIYQLWKVDINNDKYKEA